MPIKQLAGGLAWPEGPCLLPDGLTVAFVETYRSRVSVYDPTRGVSCFAVTGGGPNATILGADGYLYVTQNGGIVGPWRADHEIPASIQRIHLGSGAVEIVATEIDGLTLQAPNDLVFGPDGRLFFTDPGRYDALERPDPGYIFALSPNGKGELLAERPPTYPNGIVARSDGTIIWTETYTSAVVSRDPDGTVTEICRLKDRDAGPDGLKLGMNGDLYVTTTAAGGVQIVRPDGTLGAFLAVGTNPTNCLFVGASLYVTDGGHTGETADPSYHGCLWVLDAETEGMPLYKGEITTT